MWQNWVNELKKQIYAVYLASRNPRVPWLAKLIVVIIVAYALSPVDLIPDFIPLIGYLDDLLLLPLGIWLAIRLIPNNVWQACLAQAEKKTLKLPHNRFAAVMIISIWLLTIIIVIQWIFPSSHDVIRL